MTVRVCHIISSLEIGGAQQLLLDLCTKLLPSKFEHIVINLSDETKLAGQLRRSGCRVYCLEISGFRNSLVGCWTLFQTLKHLRPQVVHTWLYHADLLGGIAAVLAGTRPVIWSVHHANIGRWEAKAATTVLTRLLAMLSSRLPDAVIYCSQYAKTVHESIGYNPKRSWVIDNGVDVRRFRSSRALREDMRDGIRIDMSCPVVGIVARYTKVKGYRVFLEAARPILDRIASVRFVLAGTNVVSGNQALVATIQELNLTGHCHLLGERPDVEVVMNGLDVLVCTSFSESFGLVIIEALACEIPVVSSDLEVPRSIIGAEYTVPVGEPRRFADKICALLTMSVRDRSRIGMEGRNRVMESFDSQAMGEAYGRTYESVVAKNQRGPAIRSL